MIIETNCWDVLCNMCILTMEQMCHMTGLSYGFLNILLFVILGPLTTVLCFCAALCYRSQSVKWRKAGTGMLYISGVIVVSIVTLILVAFLQCV